MQDQTLWRADQPARVIAVEMTESGGSCLRSRVWLWPALIFAVVGLFQSACQRQESRNHGTSAQGTHPDGGGDAQKTAASVKVIRIGYPGVGIGGRPYLGGTVAATVHGRRALEEEFARDGIEVSWSLNKGAGPAVNELFASRQLDFAYLGDLPAIVGRSIQLETKVIAAGGRGANLYLAVNGRSPYRRLEELRGKRVAVFKGTALQLQAARMLETFGYSESDFKTITMDQAAGLAALINGDIDALWTQFPIFEYVEKGEVRILASSKDRLANGTRPATAFGVFLVTTEFERQHPELVQRVVTTVVREAAWSGDESHQAELYKLWARAGYPEIVFSKEHEGESLASRVSPLLDAEFVDDVRVAAEVSLKLSLIRKPINLEGWFEGKYVTQAIKDLKLEHYWKPHDAAGLAADR